MNRTQAKLFLLKFSLAVAAGLFVLVCVSILDTRPSESPAVVPEALLRVPASLPRLLGEKKPAIQYPSFEVWQPECLAANSMFQPIATVSPWLRISTSTCDSADIETSELRNESNQFEATIFSRSSFQFTSDFIPLVPGENKLHMDLTLKTGEKRSYDWTVTRSTGSN